MNDYYRTWFHLTAEGEEVEFIERRLRLPSGEFMTPTFYLKGRDFVVSLGVGGGDEFFIKRELDGPAANLPCPRDFDLRTRERLGKLLITLTHGVRGMPIYSDK